MPPFSKLGRKLRSYFSEVNIKEAYPADASYARCFHWGAVREHLVNVTPKQMHVASDPNHRGATCTARRSARGIGPSRHYSQQSRASRLPLIAAHPQHNAATACCATKSRQGSLHVVPASKRGAAASTDVCLPPRGRSVRSSSAIPRSTGALLSCACARVGQQRNGLLWLFLINGVWFIELDIDALRVYVGRCALYKLYSL